MSKRFILFILGNILLFCLLSQITFGQKWDMSFKHINIEQGLSNSTIECIYQDKRGFIWIGTRDGLNRYDGKHIVVYKNESNNPFSLSDNFVTAITEDSQGNIWIGTFDGLNRLDEKKNTFERFFYQKENPNSLGNNTITSLLKDHKGQLWIGTQGGILNLWNGENSFKKYFLNKSTQGQIAVTSLYQDTENNYWIGTDKGLYFFEPHNGHFQYTETITGYRPTVNCLAQDAQGNLLIGTNGQGLMSFNYRLGLKKRFVQQDINPHSLANNLVKSIWVDHKKQIWIGCINGGLNLFEPLTGHFTNYQPRPENPKSLSQRTISALFEDNQGNLWIGTHRGGINLYMSQVQKFQLFRQQPNENSLSYNDVRAFCEGSSGDIWVGTDGGGLNLFHKNTQTFEHFKHNPFQANSISSNEILGLTQDHQKRLWIATWGGGLSLLENGSRSFKRFLQQENNPNSLGSNYVQQVFEDRQQRLWIATYYGGLYQYLPDGKFVKILYGKNRKSQLLGNNIICLNQDLRGRIWIGTDDGGLNCLDPQTGIFSHYFHKDSKKPDIRIIFVDRQGRIWVGHRGLYLWHEKEQQFRLFTSKAHLSEDFIKGIVQDDEDNLWISSSNGITKLNPQNLQIQQYNSADGLQGLEFEPNAALRTKDGQIYFGGVKGFNTFYPHKIFNNNYIPPIYLTSLQIFNKKVSVGKDSPLEEDISYLKTLELSHKQNTFSIDFAALNFTASENNQYAYKLEGWDKDWIIAGSENRASYTNVSPANYTFMVKASNNDGVWNPEVTMLEVIVHPPFWATWWFRAIAFILMLTGIRTFYQFRRRMAIQQLKEQQKEELHQDQLQFFTNISHELRTPLSLILGPLDKLKKDFPSPLALPYYDMIQRNAKRLLALTNELMDFRKVESGALQLHVMQGNINIFLTEIAEEFQDLATEKGIDFRILPTSSQQTQWFDRQILEKIAINLLSNAFKYTSNGKKIEIQILESLDNFQPQYQSQLRITNGFTSSQMLYLRVADQGIGISQESISQLFERYYRTTESHIGSGIGLAFVKSLTQLHKGSIWVSSERGAGTEMLIGIPSGEKDYLEHEKWLRNRTQIRLESLSNSLESQFTEPEIPSSSSLPQNSTSKILIVDDNDELRTFLKDALQNDYQIVEAENGQIGYEQTKRHHPDVVISDVMMPVMNGVEFCKKLKTDPLLNHIPFLMLTAKSASDAQLEGVASGADYYFAKPLSIDILTQTLKNILSQRQKLKEKYGFAQLSEKIQQIDEEKDQAFLNDFLLIIHENLSDPEMNIELICNKIGMSRTKLYTKVKDLTGQPIGDFIRSIRLKTALQLMTEQQMPIAEVMYRVGIQTQSYFTKAFKNEFGKTPMQFLKELKG